MPGRMRIPKCLGSGVVTLSLEQPWILQHREVKHFCLRRNNRCRAQHLKVRHTRQGGGLGGVFQGRKTPSATAPSCLAGSPMLSRRVHGKVLPDCRGSTGS